MFCGKAGTYRVTLKDWRTGSWRWAMQIDHFNGSDWCNSPQKSLLHNFLIILFSWLVLLLLPNHSALESPECNLTLSMYNYFSISMPSLRTLNTPMSWLCPKYTLSTSNSSILLLTDNFWWSEHLQSKGVSAQYLPLPLLFPILSDAGRGWPLCCLSPRTSSYQSFKE